MSGRLKRKLGEMGVDVNSKRANESFCLIGTPLPPLEKSKDNGEFVPLWKQDVRDEQGRRRLHGAFTGGFSAGYFNTVGSKEGWTPATFTSSRNDRAKKKQARPEDFMDEEDLAELRDGRGLQDTTEEMDLDAPLRKDSDLDTEQDSIAKTLEASMLPAPRDSIGARILKRMGWRLGQGIGPRLTWAQYKKLQLTGSVPDEETGEEGKHTYAPRDTPIISVERKDNSYGLGYTPGMGLNQIVSNDKNGKATAGPKISAGFGLGALNEADDDDVDVYEGRSLHNTRLAYDIADTVDDDTYSIGSRSQGPQKPTAQKQGLQQTFHDGRPVLAGFILAEEPVSEDRWFPLPDVPKGWKPDPRRVWYTGKENSTNPAPAVNTHMSHHAWKHSGKTADERGSMLGETPLPSAPKSVFEYMSAKDRERLKNIVASTQTSSSAGAPTPTTTFAPPPAPSVDIPNTEPYIAQAALREGAFQPFRAEPLKQARYVAYLHSQTLPASTAAPDAPPPPPRLASQSIENYNKELADYAKAAALFKPMSASMASRFTSGKSVEVGPRVVEGLYTPTAADHAAKEKEDAERAAGAGKEQGKDRAKESAKGHAARTGMYGPLTREVSVWMPVKLLCKRFGVKDPNPEPMEPPPPPTAQHFGATPEDGSAGADTPMIEAADALPVASSSSRRLPGQKRDLSNIGLGEDDDQGRDTLTYQRPSMDIFKAIFASDDEGGEDSDDEREADKMVVDPPTEVSKDRDTDSSTTALKALKVDDKPVDLASFKPTFIPRSEREGAGSITKEKKSKDKKKDKKGKGKVLVSFEVEEGDNEDSLVAIQPPSKKVREGERPKKKKRKEKEDKEDEWVEKPPPEIVKTVIDVPMAEVTPRRKRATAADFM